MKTIYNKLLGSITVIFILLLIVMFNSCKKDKENLKVTVEITNPLEGNDIEIGKTVTITAKAYSTSGYITDVYFFINDVAVDTAIKIPYDYVWETKGLTEGKYILKVVAGDNNGNTASDEIIITLSQGIILSYPPIAAFTVNNKSIYLGDTSFFSDLSSNKPTDWSWDFGDGATSTEKNPAHKFDIIGTFTVILTVTNEKGSDTETKTNYITVSEPIIYETGTLMDIDGNKYSTIKIGDQWWMAENLATSKYNTGSDVGTAYYLYNDADSLKDIYGALYTSSAALSDKLCPVGWHVSTNEDWTTLINYLGGESIAGGKLKEEGTEHWQSPNKDATNEVRFNALPAGYRSALGDAIHYFNLKESGYWWTSSTDASGNVLSKVIYYSSGVATANYNEKGDALSVRCVKD